MEEEEEDGGGGFAPNVEVEMGYANGGRGRGGSIRSRHVR